MNTCLQCGDPTENPKFCSKSCSATYNNKKRAYVNTCKNCSTPTPWNQIYCSDQCKEEWWDENIRTDTPEKRRERIKKAVTDWRIRLKYKAVDYLGGECQRCGYSRCIAALEFHHRDPSQKEFGIGSGDTKAWKKVKKELGKCDLLCANCHREVHAGL